MATAENLPIYMQKTVNLFGTVTTAMANPAAAIPDNLVLLGTLEKDALLSRMWATPRANLAAGNLLIYRKPAGAARVQLVDSLEFGMINMSTTTKRPYLEFTRYTEKNPFPGVAGDSFYAGGEVAQAGLDVNITGRGR